MTAAENTLGRKAGSAVFILFTLVGIAVLLWIGYSFWPKVKQAYMDGTITTQVQPTADTGAADRIKAELAAIKAELAAARAAQQRVIVQEVPPGQAPQPVTVPAAPASGAIEINSSGEIVPAAPAPAPIIIVHQVSADGTHQTVTGSGACKVTRVAARCGDK